MAFSRTLSEGKRPRFWKLRAMPSEEISWGARASTSWSSKVIRPDCGV
jgi:hypothetical protein